MSGKLFMVPHIADVACEEAMARESTATDIVAMFRGVIAARRDPAYGSLNITDDQIRELANGLASNLLATYEVKVLT